MLLAWLEANKPRSQSPGLIKPSQAKSLAWGWLWLWLEESQAKSPGSSHGLSRCIKPSRSGAPRPKFHSQLALNHTYASDQLEAALTVQNFPSIRYELIWVHFSRAFWGFKISVEAMAQAKAKPSQAPIHGFGFGLKNMKPKPDEAKPKPGLASQAKPKHHYTESTQAVLLVRQAE
ncbi:hypothetical protein DFH06DRAFT_1133705 [Mycena polygramma]|nr:hypothetical protein DFH06DRAFT_1133705 [Mycena polygramma]